MQPLEDLGAKFIRDRSFCFDHIIIHEIIFDDSNDVTLFCTVPYYGQDYSANFGLTFDQLNVILRNTSAAGKDIAAAIAEKLKGEIEIPSVIEIDLLYGQALEVNNCIFYTTLYDFSEDEDGLDDMEDGAEEPVEGTLPSGEKEGEDKFSGEGEEADEEDDEEAFAFLIEDIRLKY